MHVHVCLSMFYSLGACLYNCDFIARDGVMCVVCMLALLKKILRQAPSKEHQEASVVSQVSPLTVQYMYTVLSSVSCRPTINSHVISCDLMWSHVITCDLM